MPAWVRDLQTNRRLSTLVSLTGQLRGVLDGKTEVEDLEDNDVGKTGESQEASVDHPGQKTEETLVQNADMEIQEQELEEVSTEKDHKDDEQAKNSDAYERTDISKDALPVQEKMGQTEEEMPEGHLQGDCATLQEDGSKEGKEQVGTEVGNTSSPEHIEMPQVLKMEELQEEDASSPSTDTGEETGKKKRRSGRLNVRGKSAEKVDTTSGPSSSTKGNTNSPEVCETPKAHNKKRRSPTARKTFLPKEENDSTPLKRVHKKVSMNTDSPKEAKEDGASTSRRKSVEIQDKTRNITKDGSRASLSPVSTPQRRAGSKGRRSSVLTPRGQRSSPRGSPGHVMKRNVRGETPLHLAAIKHEACNHGHTRVAEVLLDHRALINTTAFENDSPLHDAVANGRVEVARLLVSRGASLDVRNKLGHLPADLAVSEAMKEALNTKPLHTQPQVVMTTSSQVGQVVALATGLDTKQREALEQCMLVLDGKVVKTFSDQVTHLVAACDDTRRCPRTIKYLRGVLTGKWIVSFKWVSACLEEQQHVPEGPYEVLGTAAKPDSTGASRGRLNKEQQLPGLFDGCHFFLHGKFQPPTPPRKELIELIRAGGGGVLAREPKPDSDCLQASTTVAYHARKDSDLAHCSHFILYDEKSAKIPPRIRTAKLCTVPVTWLMDCVTDFSLLELPN
uniref:BRCT domain-containing protein n=1 Tax=Branchiostoma floridae TaxID=7739 RepID=C3Y4F4_BRAFL|eukprot:XP_002608818.1 hypothetical protein BRAFLDRAFT_89685 [Branchiostoma floridae]